MELDKKQIAVVVAAFFLSVGIGFMAAEIVFSAEEQPEMFDESFNVTVGPETQTEQVNFDNRTVELFWEDVPLANAFIDKNLDGSYDRELNITSDGQQRTTEEVINMENSSYRLHFRYMDEEERGTGFLTLYRIQKII